MQNKKGLIVGTVVLVAVIALAAVAYNALGAGAGAQQNISLSSSSAEAEASSTSSTAASSNADAEQDAASSTSTSQDVASSTNSETATDDTNATTSDTSAATEAATKTKFNDFTINVLDSGEEVALSSFYGKPTLLCFWATWCPPCNAEAPHIQKLWETYGDQVDFVMVNTSVDNGRDSPKSIQEWMDEGGYSYPVYYDEGSEATLETQVYYLPTMIVLDKDGTILTGFSGALDEESGTHLIEQLLAL